MKKYLQKSILIISALCLLSTVYAQTRYLDEVFSGVTVTSNVQYGQNITVLSGSPTLQPLMMDVYEPTGDTASQRPVILYLHTGSFLPPPINGQCTGTKMDSAAIEMCTRFAKKGYVVFNLDYRLGWNPVSPDQDTRTSTLINAAYRGVQDAKSCVRYLRKSVATMSNPYKVDDTRIVIGGQGTGGYVALAYATLDSYADITLPKLLNLSSGNPYIDTSLSGDWDGYGGSILNVDTLNNLGYSNAINMVFNMGGALGDSSWLLAGNVPMVCFHVPNDPFAPYGYGPVIVPTTGQFVINVSGSYDVVRRANMLGNNAVFYPSLTDTFTTIANTINDGYDGLYPLLRPVPPPPSPATGEAGPWEWWDTTCTQHASGLYTNPDMHPTKGRAYIDTIQAYLAPRMCLALVLGMCPTQVGVQTKDYNRNVSIFPNPATDKFMIDAKALNKTIQTVSIYDLSGRLTYRVERVNALNREVNTSEFASGMYFLKVEFDGGEIVKKISIQ